MGGRAVVLAAMALAVCAPRVRAEGPLVTARAAVIVDAATGEALWERNADTPLPPASTTKVLTAIVALESGRLDDAFPVSVEAAETAPSKIGLRPGERMALGNLLYALLLNSANDAAVVVAEGVAGSETAFAARMNAKARALGATHSHFVNPHGLTADGHVATARDLATIFRYGLGLPRFRQILETPRIAVPLESHRIHTVGLHSHNRLLTGYTYRVIGKTGYTRPAGRCFVGAASAGGREVIIALLGSRDLWGDARRLFAHALGGPSESLPVVVASRRSRRGAGRSVATAEGDEDAAPRPRHGVHVRLASRSVPAETPTAERFTVRVGPFGSRHQAEATRQRLAHHGYAGRVVGRTVMLGDFPSRKQADRLVASLRIKGFRPTIVARN